MLTFVSKTLLAPRTVACLAILVVLVASPARAASDVRIGYPALQRLLAEQAFSPDDGRTWETNWIMTMTRIG